MMRTPLFLQPILRPPYKEYFQHIQPFQNVSNQTISVGKTLERGRRKMMRTTMMRIKHIKLKKKTYKSNELLRRQAKQFLLL